MPDGRLADRVARYPADVTRRILILGCTGSVGVQALDVIETCDDLVLCGLACGSGVDTMHAQSARHGGVPTSCVVGGGTVEHDPAFGALMDAARPDMVLNAIVGAAGLAPTLEALQRGIDVALANKESLVVGGDLVLATVARTGARLLPVDSEHSALFQLLDGVERSRVRRAVLTASGGPFFGRSAKDLAGVTIADALRHPTWSMGAKITIDSATLMNKGLEVIEARHLFALADDEVEVIVHPQSLIHAMVRLEDGSVLTHCGPPDMRVPIGYALRHPAPPPQRPVIDLIGRELTFFSPDADTFKCLALARQAGDTGGTAPAVLNGANEVAVAAFLDGRIGFMDIPALVAHALDTVPVEPADTLDGVMAADHAARTAVSAAMAVRV
jgi:1-deoxy-D-xylulose-5-phosphate reductoisomerase